MIAHILWAAIDIVLTVGFLIGVRLAINELWR